MNIVRTRTESRGKWGIPRGYGHRGFEREFAPPGKASDTEEAEQFFEPILRESAIGNPKQLKQDKISAGALELVRFLVSVAKKVKNTTRNWVVFLVGEPFQS